MARIIYGVAGEGFGHSSRSHLIGQHLIDAGRNVLFVASGKSFSYLRRHFGENVQEIFGLRPTCSDRRLSPLGTVVQNVHRLIRRRDSSARPCREVLDSFCPDLVITDFEPFSAWWAWRNRVPFVSIDHHHVLTMCDLEHSPGELLSRLSVYCVTRCHGFGAAAYIILNFFPVPVRDKGAVLAPPVVRPIVHSYAPTCGAHILVYLTDATAKSRLLATLNSFAEQGFRIYGFNVREQAGNCEFRKTSTEDFLSDLASCRGVIATAGFSLISECLYFHKKMLLLPIQGQYEQVANAYHAERLNLALCRNRLDGVVLTEYLGFLDEPVRPQEDVLWPDNEQFFRLLHRTLGEVCPACDAVSARVSTDLRVSQARTACT